MSDILSVLVYFDLFDYPLTETEVKRFIQSNSRDESCLDTLLQLVENHRVFNIDGFYSLRNDRTLSINRVLRNRRAAELLKTADRTSRFLYGFPFVRGIFISGSLSKNVSDENGDIDYFIITSSGRLWIARTLMHVFKKFCFLVGKQHWYCMNYFIDESALEIEEKNIYTAMELVTLLPFQGKNMSTELRKVNEWTREYFPYADLEYDIKEHSPIRRKLKRILECALDHHLTDKLDNYLMEVTTRRWARKEGAGKRNIKGARMGITTGKHFCKPNPRFFQDKLLKKYNTNLSLLRNQHCID